MVAVSVIVPNWNGRADLAPARPSRLSTEQVAAR